MSDFEQQIPAPITMSDIKTGIEGVEFSNLRPEIISLDKLRLKKATADELEKRLESRDIHTLNEITEARKDFEVYVGEEGYNQVYVKRLGKTEKDQDLIFTYERGFAVSGQGTFPTSCNDILVGGKDNQFLSIKSLFPDSDKLGIRLAILDIDPGDVILTGGHNLLAFGLSFAYNSESHSLELFEPNGDINFPIVSHEAGHAWVRKLNLVKDDYKRVFFDNDEELDQIENFDESIFLRIREQKNDERLASFISGQVIKKVRSKLYSLKSGEISDGRESVLEPALMSYDRGFAYALMKYVDHFNLDATKLFGARMNRTDEGIKAIREALSFSDEVHKSLSPSIEILLENGKLKKTSNEWSEPYPRRYVSPAGDFQLNVYVTAKGRIIQGEVEFNKDKPDGWVFNWSPYTGVTFYNADRKLGIVPGSLSARGEQSITKLREKTKEIEEILKDIV